VQFKYEPDCLIAFVLWHGIRTSDGVIDEVEELARAVLNPNDRGSAEEFKRAIREREGND
jgi:hypothetical protein